MIRLAEPWVDEIIAGLTADLQARIDAIAAAAPAIEMKPVAKISFGAKQNVPMPAIEVIPNTSPIEYDGRDEVTFRHRIAIVIRAQAQDEEKLERLLQRYAAAVIQTCLDRRAARTWTFDLQLVTEDLGQLDWGPVLGNDRGLFQADVLIGVVANASDQR